ncbi:cryptochrome/photolyase family protein [Hellea balneolensis]|uniref:cryptochrome/photolyase family protein n=1 Tax=Hellea balneolensis TaxID=287478 RepID=UPI000424C64C|nr:deoxyribodipyrimidine photo-lyase [Hellea balneolensis]
MTDTPIIVWFRRDLRITDNPALSEAAKTGRAVIPLYIFETDAERALGAASLWWLHHSLKSLQKDLADMGLEFCLRKGRASDILESIIGQTGAKAVYWNRRYAKEARERDEAIKSHMGEREIEARSFRANLLSEPWKVETKTGGYYKVFTPYWRAAKDYLDVEDPLPAPKNVSAHSGTIASDDLDNWQLLPSRPDWGEKMKPHWTIGSQGAKAALESFLGGPVEEYAEDRNRPDKEDGTSRLSPHLAFGEISPKQIWHGCKGDLEKARVFLSEIGWREFSYVLLFHNPKLATENFKDAFDNFEWNHNEAKLERWQHGQTGYPFVDAGMRQLWQTGWQHNRVRMVTASFLIKHLLIDWREGEKWFHDTLVDADPASNAASWQWVAGSGADASPYFRIFNPFTQGEKFDPNGDYVRRFVPELSKLPKKYIHRPWEAPQNVLDYAGVKLGRDYPKPIVDHKKAREKALAAYKASRE